MRHKTHSLSKTGLALSLMLSLAAQAEDLSSMYQRAAENDAELQAARFTLQAEQQTRPLAKSSLLPQIDLTASRSQVSVDSSSGDTDYGRSQIELSLTQSLYQRDRWIRLDQADTAIASAEANYATAEQKLILKVAEAYFDVLAGLDNQEFARAEKQAIAEQLSQAQQRYKVGLIAVTDVKEAQARYDLAQAREIEADNQLATSQEALLVITGQSPTQLERLREDAPLTEPTPADINAWVSTAENQNQAYAAARLATENARQQIELNRSGHYPSLDLVASHGTQDIDDGPAEGDTTTTSIGLRLSIPLYSGGATSAAVTQAHAQFNAAQATQELTRRQLLQQTRDAYLGVAAAISRAQALRQALVSTEAGAEATRAGFDVGTRTSVEVLVALQDTYGAQRDYARARYDYFLHSLRLKLAAGTLSADDLTAINAWLN